MRGTVARDLRQIIYGTGKDKTDYRDRKYGGIRVNGKNAKIGQMYSMRIMFAPKIRQLYQELKRDHIEGRG